MVSPKSIRERQRYAEDPESREKRSARDRRYLAAHKDEINHRRRTDPEYKARRNCRRYGLRPEDYRELLARQGGLCAICKKRRPLGIDHCHATRRCAVFFATNATLASDTTTMTRVFCWRRSHTWRHRVSVAWNWLAAPPPRRKSRKNCAGSWSALCPLQLLCAAASRMTKGRLMG
jgi:hypothetical protein